MGQRAIRRGWRPGGCNVSSQIPLGHLEDIGACVPLCVCVCGGGDLGVCERHSHVYLSGSVATGCLGMSVRVCVCLRQGGHGACTRGCVCDSVTVRPMWDYLCGSARPRCPACGHTHTCRQRNCLCEGPPTGKQPEGVQTAPCRPCCQAPWALSTSQASPVLPCNWSGTTRLNLSMSVSSPELGVISVVVRIKLVNIMEAFKTALGTQ